MGPPTFRFDYLLPYAEAFEDRLKDEATVIDTIEITPPQAALDIARLANDSCE